MQETDDALDMILLIMAVAVFTPIMVYCSIPFFKGDVGGFDVQIEKTALETEREIIPEERTLTANDVLLMMVIADRFTPEPQKVRLNVSGPSLEVAIDEEFLLNKAAKLQIAKGALPENRNVTMELHSGPSGMRFWNVKEAQP